MRRPAFLDLTVQGSRWTSNLVPPVVRINGHPLVPAYGTRRIPVPPGPVHIEAHAQWLRRYGQADLTLTLAPDEVVPVFYAPPWHQFTRGSLGHSRQRRRGLVVSIGLVVLIVIAVLALMFLPYLFST